MACTPSAATSTPSGSTWTAWTILKLAAEQQLGELFDSASATASAPTATWWAMEAMDTHLSTVSNRLNVVMTQLAIIATVFLPLSF